MWIYLSLRQGYVPVNFHPGLLLSYVTLSSVFVQFSANILKIQQLITFTNYQKLNNPSGLPALQPSLGMNRILYTTFLIMIQKFFNLLESSPSHMSFPLDFTITLLQLMLTLIKAELFNQYFYSIFTSMTTVYLIQLI